ncbi:S66 family peptidase [Bacillus sp. KH172YL63]|uniref:S66 family peptidase n=1 Tax=Bacillus sp. KH172YL63 TaxID=2709784 RepID=UPI0013E45701|nr:S66 peptidase family protein [Bacillus sp. KH172YL63]BCB03742.1 LD-carboxypeptidase [Bacillus sp. KH172YL63]
MITYPILKKDAMVGVTAPSSGVPDELHGILKEAILSMEKKGYEIKCGETVWTQRKAKSAPANKRAAELNHMLQDDNISLIIPPWGGQLLVEILDHIDFDLIKPKWILGYSDISVLLLAVTLKTGIAITAHGTNLVDLRGEHSDQTTAEWENVLSTKEGASVTQYSSPQFQKAWDHESPSPVVFHLTEPTHWKAVGDSAVQVEGRLLGGCIDVIRHLIGTPYGDIEDFVNIHTDNERILWYLENCELSSADLRRTLVQMKLAGWFDQASGIMFGRSAANHTVGDYTVEDVYAELQEELNIPVLYDIDCGHQPPQLTFINGSYGCVEVKDGEGRLKQIFK